MGFACEKSLLAVAVIAQAQQPTKLPRIGYLSATSSSANVGRIDAFRQGLRELGYVEGKNIVIEWRYADGNLIGCRRLWLSWCVSR
jgi:putative ABC transport system substrate-binding protein